MLENMDIPVFSPIVKQKRHPQHRTIKKDVNGVLLLNKSIGLSSNQALQKIKHLYQATKAGHTGTLDPLATGLLPICFGEATKFSSYLLDGNKEYIATIKLGTSTTTYDAEGDIIATKPVNVTMNDIETAVNSFLGKCIQIPPIYSALKVNGRALYEYARRGEEVEIKPREIELFELEILNFLPNNEFRLRVVCSKGTYIRTLAHDIGVKLLCGAYLSGLVRIKTNDFELDETITLEYLRGLDNIGLMDALLPVDILVNKLAIFNINDSQFEKIKVGHAFFMTADVTGLTEQVRLYYHDKFLGIANVTGLKVQPMRLINDVNRC